MLRLLLENDAHIFRTGGNRGDVGADVDAASGDSLMVIGVLLGHRSTKTTECYTHLADHPIKAVADHIADEVTSHPDQILSAGADPAEGVEEGDPFDTY